MGDAVRIAAVDDQAHGPCGLLEQAPDQRIEVLLRMRAGQVARVVGQAVREAADDAGVDRPRLEVDRELDEGLGIGERPVDRRVEQAEQQRRIDDHVGRLQRGLQLHAACLRFARAMREHAVQRIGQLQPLVRLAHPPRGEARQLLSDDADLARLLDLLAQRAQTGAVDLAGGDQRVDAFECGRQRRRDLGTDLRDERVPALRIAALDLGRSHRMSGGVCDMDFWGVFPLMRLGASTNMSVREVIGQWRERRGLRAKRRESNGPRQSVRSVLARPLFRQRRITLAKPRQPNKSRFVERLFRRCAPGFRRPREVLVGALATQARPAAEPARPER